MVAGSILLVHGTGVRLKSYSKSFEIAEKTARDCSIGRKLVACAWGDPLGVEFNGLSLPDEETAEDKEKREADLAHWVWILDDPLAELSLLGTPDPKAKKAVPLPEGQTPGEKLLATASAYVQSLEFNQILARCGLEDLWDSAKVRVLTDKITKRAFESSAHEPAEAYRALARALVAQLHVEATSLSRPGPSSIDREKLVQRLLMDWGQQVYGISDRFMKFVARAGTRYVRDRRNAMNVAAALPLGDVLLYQTHGATIRSFIRRKIEKDCSPPTTMVAHSLGGIACVDLLALEDIPNVDYLVTIGSQSSFMHEIGSLASLKPGAALRAGFPKWLNVFDRNDFLSFFASRVFPNATDFEASSGQPFPDSHSAYFGSEVVWTRIRSFISGQG